MQAAAASTAPIALAAPQQPCETCRRSTASHARLCCLPLRHAAYQGTAAHRRPSGQLCLSRRGRRRGRGAGPGQALHIRARRHQQQQHMARTGIRIRQDSSLRCRLGCGGARQWRGAYPLTLNQRKREKQMQGRRAGGKAAGRAAAERQAASGSCGDHLSGQQQAQQLHTREKRGRCCRERWRMQGRRGGASRSAAVSGAGGGAAATARPAGCLMWCLRAPPTSACCPSSAGRGVAHASRRGRPYMPSHPRHPLPPLVQWCAACIPTERRSSSSTWRSRWTSPLR